MSPNTKRPSLPLAKNAPGYEEGTGQGSYPSKRAKHENDDEDSKQDTPAEIGESFHDDEDILTSETLKEQDPASSRNMPAENIARPSYETIRANPTDPAFFNQYLFALLSFKVDTGTYAVHKDACPNLYAWLGHMRREYARLTHQPATATLTAEQKKILEYLHVPLTHRGDDHWNRFYNMLRDYKERHGHVLVPRLCEVPGLGDWVTDQRRQYKAYKLGKASQLTTERRERLEKLGFTFQVRSRPQWDKRYEELVEYKKKHGDCKVPQHFSENRALGKWVAKQREQYKLKKKGRHSFLTPDREEKLNNIGFLWQVRSAIAEENEDELQRGQQIALPSTTTTLPPTGIQNTLAAAQSDTSGLTAHPPATDPLAMRDVANL